MRLLFCAYGSKLALNSKGLRHSNAVKCGDKTKLQASPEFKGIKAADEAKSHQIGL